MKLTVKAGRGDKMHLHIDGEYFLTVDNGYLAELGVFNGMDVDCEDIERLRVDIGVRRAYNKAVDLLSRRDHSRKELLDKLRQKGYGEYAVEAIEKLNDYGYIDDKRFAQIFAEELVRLKSYGKKRVEQELYRKGVERDIICEVISECDFPSEKLAEIIERKYSRYLNDEKGVNKTVNALLRLGYTYTEIRDAIREITDREDFENIYE
ncbi:MAG: regulatory protein RecX [Clostridia bacterium]|nr:regulatory protein RecX [Clostridia bacterium]